MTEDSNEQKPPFIGQGATSQRLKSLSHLRSYLVRKLATKQENQSAHMKGRIQAEVLALSWAIQELNDIPPRISLHTIKVVKDGLVNRLKSYDDVGPEVIAIVQKYCLNLSNRVALGNREPYDPTQG